MKRNEVPKVLIVDDDQDILDLLAYNLSKEDFRVKTVSDSKKAIKVGKRFEPDLIVLDLMMDHPNGIELCREFRSSRKFEKTWIFFLTAKSDVYFQHAAFETGADDYIEKIMGLRALTYKIKAVLKEHLVISKRLPEITVGDFIFRRKSYLVIQGGHELKLSKPEFELLYFMAQNENIVLSADHLLYYLWGSEVYLTSSTIDNYLALIKSKIGNEYLSQTFSGHYVFHSSSRASSTSANNA
jgi:two-component system alkaline phosphatase synthesis response regulator PhoP